MGLLDRHGLHPRSNTSSRFASSFDVPENPCGIHIAPLCLSAPSPEGVCHDAAWPAERARSTDMRIPHDQVQSHCANRDKNALATLVWKEIPLASRHRIIGAECGEPAVQPY
jgi:hypothetical protein